jgi:hypothetical protein
MMKQANLALTLLLELGVLAYWGLQPDRRSL